MRQEPWKARAWERVAEGLAKVELLLTYLAGVAAELCYAAHRKAFSYMKMRDITNDSTRG